MRQVTLLALADVEDQIARAALEEIQRASADNLINDVTVTGQALVSAADAADARSTLGVLASSQSTFTLTASATSTVVTDANVSATSVILWMPTTANAAAQMNTLYCGTVGAGSFTLTHASSANVDQTFAYVVMG